MAAACIASALNRLDKGTHKTARGQDGEVMAPLDLDLVHTIAQLRGRRLFRFEEGQPIEMCTFTEQAVHLYRWCV